MSQLVVFFSATLLAGSAGLNPFLPLFVVGVISRYTGRFEPVAPYGFVGETWLVVAAGVLFLLHIFSDKLFVPGDSLGTPPGERDRRAWIGVVHDLGQMLLGPLIGALLMGTTDRFFPPSWPLAAPMLGALLAALVYVGKRAWRHRLSDRWGPFSNLLLSTLEDVAALLLTLVGIVLMQVCG